VGHFSYYNCPGISSKIQTTMFKTTTAIFIERSAKKIMPYFVEPEHWPLWLDQLKTVETHPPHITRKGARYTQTLTWGKQMIALEGTLTLFKPPSQFSFLIQSADLSVNGEYYFEERSGGTYVTYRESTKERSLYIFIMAPITRLIMKKRALQSLLTLKILCEGKS
jgi:hypothetical protein